jgi:hypothetical protein
VLRHYKHGISGHIEQSERIDLGSQRSSFHWCGDYTNLGTRLLVHEVPGFPRPAEVKMLLRAS